MRTYDSYLKSQEKPNQFNQIYTQGINFYTFMVYSFLSNFHRIVQLGWNWLPAYLPVDSGQFRLHQVASQNRHWYTGGHPISATLLQEYLIWFCFSSNLHHLRTSQKIKNTILLDFAEICVRCSYRFSFTNKVKNCWPSPSSSFEHGRWILRI